MVDKSEQTAEGKASAAQGPREVIVRVDHEFQYRGAHFERGKFYRVRDEPNNFISWHIEHNRNGAVIGDSAPGKAQVLDDPRPAAMQAAKARADAEADRVRQLQGPRVEEPRRSVPGQAQVFTDSSNVVGQEHTPEGSRPAQQPSTSHASAQKPAGEGDKPGATDGDKSGADGGDGKSASDRPRLPKTAP